MGDACQDTDEDTIVDAEDLCPEIAGDMNGCPDSDNDGLDDASDACPEEAGAEATQGCPDSDTDGVSDNTDECPADWGVIENNGCPPIGTVSSNVNLREGPGTNFEIVTTIPAYSEFILLGRNQAQDWFRIRTIPADNGDAVEAWVFANLVVTDFVSIDLLPVIEE